MRPSAVELLLEHRASLSKVNLCVLWTIRGGDALGLYRTSAPLRELFKRPYNLRSLSAQEQMNHLRRFVVPLLDMLMPEPLFSEAFERRCQNAKQQHASTAGSGVQSSGGTMPPVTPRSSTGTGSAGSTGSVRSGLGSRQGLSRLASKRRSTAYDPAFDVTTMGDGTVASFIRASDVFFWAVAHGAWELSHVLWAATKNPVRGTRRARVARAMRTKRMHRTRPWMAHMDGPLTAADRHRSQVRCSLLASKMCKQLSHLLAEQKERMLQQADDFELRAMSVLDNLPAEVAADRSCGFLLQVITSSDRLWFCLLVASLSI